MGVFGAGVSDGGGSHVPDEHVGAQILGEAGHVYLGAFVDGSASKQDLARLVETDSPAQCRSLRDYVQRFAFELEDARPEIRSVTDEAEESCHRFSPENPETPRYLATRIPRDPNETTQNPTRGSP